MGNAFEDNCWRVLNRAYRAWEADQGTEDNGDRSAMYYRDIENVGVIMAHLMERGFMSFSHDSGLRRYTITDAGRKELARITQSSVNETEDIKAEIARLETALAAARARLASHPVGEMRGFMGAKADNLHEGE